MSATLSTSDFLTNDDIAQLVRVPVSTVRYWKHMGEGPRSLKVGRRVLYRREDVDAWLAAKYEAPEA
jgi:excisionase family DNA binding protein